MPGTHELESPAHTELPDEALLWIEHALPTTFRRLMDGGGPESPLHELPLAQLRLANALFDAGERTPGAGETMGRLSTQLGVKQNALTQAADRLMHRGLAERFSDPADRRIVRMRLSERGKAAVGERRARRRARFQRLWAGLNPADREMFVNAVRFLESVSLRVDSPGGVSPAGAESMGAPH